MDDQGLGQGRGQLEVPEISTALALSRQQLDMAVSTAKKYPRDLQRFTKRVEDLALSDVEVAASCFYVLERKQKDKKTGEEKIVRIQGPSIRFAEICANAWGNLKYGARVLEIGEQFLTAEGAAHDLEINNYSSQEVRRAISGKFGRFSNDMIVMNANAACSIALRNALFKAVPWAKCKPTWDATVAFAVGDERALIGRRDKALAKFSEIGVTARQILARLGLKDFKEIHLKELQTLLGIWSLIDTNESTVEDEFGGGPAKPEAEPATKPVQGAQAAPAGEPSPAPTPEAESETAARQAALKDYQAAFSTLVSMAGQEVAEEFVKKAKGRKGIPSMGAAELGLLVAAVVGEVQARVKAAQVPEAAPPPAEDDLPL